MPNCPKCGKAIDELVDWSRAWIKPPDDAGEYCCPECGEVLFYDEEKASEFLKKPVEMCSECGRSVKLGSGRFVNRVPDANDVETRREMGMRDEARIKSVEELKEELKRAIFDVLEGSGLAGGFSIEIAEMFAEPIALASVAMNDVYGYEPEE